MRGRFITFEGGEGSGKSTQVRLLAQRLRANLIDTVVTREPGGTPGAEAIRHVLLGGVGKVLGPDAEAILFAGARNDHIQTLIAPALAAGRWVVCDRFADSTRVYQGMLGRADLTLVAQLERVVVGDNRPDLTIVLDLPPYVGLERAARRRGTAVVDRFESEAPAFHATLREAYRALVESEPDRCVLVDAVGNPETIAYAIWELVARRFGLRRAPRARAAVS
jgi:dTMP kinase